MTDEHTTQERLLASIKEGKLKMKPRWQFLAGEGFTLLLGLVIGIGLLYLASFVPYATRMVMPLIFAVIFVVLFDAFLRRHSSTYQRPIVVTLAIILFIVVLASFFLMRLRAHERIHRFVHMRGVPVFDPFYQHFGPPMPPRMMR